MPEEKFMVYAIDKDPFNDISIECSSIEDMDNYAAACKEQGYIDVKTKAKPLMECFLNCAGNEYSMPMCPRCKEPSYSQEHCPFCGQWIEWD